MKSIDIPLGILSQRIFALATGFPSARGILGPETRSGEALISSDTWIGVFDLGALPPLEAALLADWIDHQLAPLLAERGLLLARTWTKQNRPKNRLEESEVMSLYAPPPADWSNPPPPVLVFLPELEDGKDVARARSAIETLRAMAESDPRLSGGPGKYFARWFDPESARSLAALATIGAEGLAKSDELDQARLKEIEYYRAQALDRFVGHLAGEQDRCADGLAFMLATEEGKKDPIAAVSNYCFKTGSQYAGVCLVGVANYRASIRPIPAAELEALQKELAESGIDLLPDEFKEVAGAWWSMRHGDLQRIFQ